MAFVKKPMFCQDAPASFQHVNALGDNLDSLKTDLEVEHVGLGEQVSDNAVFPPTINIGNFEFGGEAPADALQIGATPGAHESVLIARGGAYVSQYVPQPNVISVELYDSWGCLNAMQVLDTGVYFFPVTGFSKVWGRVTPWGDDVTPVLDARVNPGPPFGPGMGLTVRTFMEQENGDSELELLPYHTGFYLLCYGRR